MYAVLTLSLHLYSVNGIQMNETRSYHHGNLREELISAALQAIEESGHQALSLRDLALVVGVSRAAPYRHFSDRDALLRACAHSGFSRLQAVHRKVMEGDGTAQHKAQLVCQSFLAFSERQPQLFMLMYDSGLLQKIEEGDELGSLLHSTYDGVGATLAAALQETDETRLKARMIAMWSTLYGYAHLRQSHMLKPYMLKSLSQEQTEAAVIAAAIGPLPG